MHESRSQIQIYRSLSRHENCPCSGSSIKMVGSIETTKHPLKRKKERVRTPTIITRWVSSLVEQMARTRAGLRVIW